MNGFLNFFQFLLNLGNTLLLPVLIFLLGLLLKMKFGDALMSGLKIGIGLTLINVALGTLIGAYAPAAAAMAQKVGINLTTIDVGWGSLSGIAFAGQMGLLVIPLFLVVNILLIVLKWTNTINVDIWNFWHVAFVATMAQIATGSFAAGIVVAVLLVILILKFADLTQKDLSEWMGIPGVSVTTLNMVSQTLVTRLFQKIFPKKSDVTWDSETMRARFGVLGEPIFQSVVIGIIFGLLAGYDAKAIWSMSITIAAVLYILPKVIGAIMEGFTPLAEAAKVFFKKTFKNRELFIGVDWILLLKPEHLSFGLPFIPIAVLLAFILPGNKVLPLGDLSLAWAGAFVTLALLKGDMLRSFVVALVTLVATFYIATWNASFITEAALAAGQTLPEGANAITGLVDSMDFVQNGFLAISQFLGGLF